MAPLIQPVNSGLALASLLTERAEPESDCIGTICIQRVSPLTLHYLNTDTDEVLPV